MWFGYDFQINIFRFFRIVNVVFFDCIVYVGCAKMWMWLGYNLQVNFFHSSLAL